MPKEFRIPAGKAKYENWEMPDLTGVQRSINKRLEELENEEVDPVETVTEESYNPPTLEELEQLRAEFEEEGRAEGLAKGLEEGRQTGFEEGKTQGFQEAYETGYSEGLANAREVVEAEISKWQNLQEQIIEPLKVVDEDVELAIVELIKLISTGVLRRELNLSRGELRDIVRDAIASLPNKNDRVVLRVNPEDAQIVESACIKTLEDYKIVADENITKGGTVLEMKNSLVNSTVERRYQALVDMIIGEAYPKSYLTDAQEAKYALGSGSFSNKNALQELQKLQSELQNTDFKSLVHQSLTSEFDNNLEVKKQEFHRQNFNESQAPVDFSQNETVQEFNEPQTPVDFSQNETVQEFNEPQTPVDFSQNETVQEFNEPQMPVDFSQNETVQEFNEPQTPVDFSQSETVQEFNEPQTPVDFSQEETLQDLSEPQAYSQKPKVELGKYRKTPQSPVDFNEDDDLVDLSLYQNQEIETKPKLPQGKYRKVSEEQKSNQLETGFSENEENLPVAEDFAETQTENSAGVEDLEIDQDTVSNWLHGEENLSNLVAENKKNRLNVMQFPGDKQKTESKSPTSSLVEGSYLDKEPKDLNIDNDLVDLSAFDDD